MERANGKKPLLGTPMNIAWMNMAIYGMPDPDAPYAPKETILKLWEEVRPKYPLPKGMLIMYGTGTP